MSLHSIIEPAGTLMTGWVLVPERDHGRADPRNTDAPCPADPAEGDRTPASTTKSSTTRSKWELRKVG